MSNLQMIQELCAICESLIHIVEAQRLALAQHNAVAAEEEIAATRNRYTALLGAGEWPDQVQEEQAP